MENNEPNTINNKSRAITLQINKDTWKEFKYKTPRTHTLNDKIVELIERYIKEN